MHETKRGLVLREVAYREADMMLTVLTESGGKVAAAARGVRRKNSKLSAAVQPLAYSEFSFYEGGGRTTVNEAEPIELFFELRTDLVKFALASYFSELLEVTADAEVENPELIRLGLNSFYALAKLNKDPRLVKAAFELRVVRYAGYQPSLGVCPVCGKAPSRPVFSLTNGALYCATCPKVGKTIEVDAGVLAAMHHVLSCDLKKIFSFRLDEQGMNTLSLLAEEFLLEHFERSFKTLSFYRDLA